MDEIDILVVFSLFIFRIGIPLVITFSLAYLIDRFMTDKPSDEADSTQSQETDPFFSPCWEMTECLPDRRSTCQVPHRPGVPCWLTMQLSNGHLPDDCMDCPVFRHNHVSKEDVAV